MEALTGGVLIGQLYKTQWCFPVGKELQRSNVFLVSTDTVVLYLLDDKQRHREDTGHKE